MDSQAPSSSTMDSKAHAKSKEEKVALALEIKGQGNDFFKAGDYRMAMKRYHSSLLHVKGIEDRVTEEGISKDEVSSKLKKDIEQLQFGCFNNLAACLLKQKKWERVIDYATKALEIEPNNIKAMFRRGQGYYNNRDFDKAEADFNKIKSIDPNETCGDRYLSSIEIEHKRQEQKRKQMCVDIFNKMADGNG